MLAVQQGVADKGSVCRSVENGAILGRIHLIRFAAGDRVVSARGYVGTIYCAESDRLYRVRWDIGFESRVTVQNLEAWTGGAGITKTQAPEVVQRGVRKVRA